MHDDFIRKQIAAVAGRDDRQLHRLIAFIASACWPGGAADRREPVAADWLRRWRPAGSSPAVPVCSCADGHCALCN
jgi:hypothetical protein